MIRKIIMARRGLGLLAVGALVVLLGADEGDCEGAPQINNTVIVCASADGGGKCGNEAQSGNTSVSVDNASEFKAEAEAIARRGSAGQLDAFLAAGLENPTQTIQDIMKLREDGDLVWHFPDAAILNLSKDSLEVNIDKSQIPAFDSSSEEIWGGRGSYLQQK